MAIITKDRLNSLTEGFAIRTKTFSDVLNEGQSESRSSAASSIFLSHSHSELEKDEVKRTISFLRGLGLSIYIDSDDSSMPPFTNARTAEKIKQEIKANKKFILLATNAAINSKWCNWELGLGDAHKYIANISLFPLSENVGGWIGNEYLNIYPRIEEIYPNSFRVINPNSTSVDLIHWLRS